ncbi:MAG TPA: phytanoyl-CoA dioxygenase family protein, partial [Candidatus Obscuribacterales bacterium]
MTSEDGFKIAAPDGRSMSIPVAVEEGSDPYPAPENPEALRDYYDKYGYVVVRRLIPEELCQAVLAAYGREVKPYDGFLYRQPSSGRAERHVFSEHGHLLNSILNLQDLDPRSFAAFRAAGLKVFSDARLQKVVSALLGESGVLVQSMFFEGNPVTWAHQDTYYLDSTALGRLVAAWIALEDIRPGAGRFYVYPESHKIDLVRHGGDFDIAFNHERYKALILKVIDEH